MYLIPYTFVLYSQVQGLDATQLPARRRFLLVRIRAVILSPFPLPLPLYFLLLVLFFFSSFCEVT